MLSLLNVISHRGQVRYIVKHRLLNRKRTGNNTTAGKQFTVLNWKKHLKADPWAEISKVRQKLPE
jgi:hypothetical protein